VPISGISAVNNSPKFPGETVVFTATISSGTNVSYTWDFGDGSVGSGASVTHVYTQARSFTAVVTASNSANSQSFSSPVTILSIGPSNRMFLPVVTK
jgi:PKD repeat protein